ncbi:MAG TPA: transcriptional regulator [Rhodobacteraceae bacterium]|nr:transcriptional regulator [Paracoccaceae bacterium]
MPYAESFAALADPTRRQVFEMLAAKPMPVGALAECLPVSRPAVSQHLKVLTDAGLVAAQPEGARRIYSVRREGLAELRAWIDRYWDDVLAGFHQDVMNQTGEDH